MHLAALLKTDVGTNFMISFLEQRFVQDHWSVGFNNAYNSVPRPPLTLVYVCAWNKTGVLVGVSG